MKKDDEFFGSGRKDDFEDIFSSENFDMSKYDVYRSYKDKKDEEIKPLSGDSGRESAHPSESVMPEPQKPALPAETPMQYEDVYSYSRPGDDGYEDVNSSLSGYGLPASGDLRDRKVPSDFDLSITEDIESSAKKSKKNGGRKNGGKKMKTWKKVMIAVSCVLIVALVAGGFGLKYILSGLNYKPIDQGNNLDISQDISNKYGDQNIINIALFGVDSRDNNSFSGNSDGIKIVSINRDTAKIKLITILRDSEVPIEGHGKEKITHAYSYGGAALAVKTLNQNFNMNISEYATVNFSKMGDLIEIIGGIDMDITELERQHINAISTYEGYTGPILEENGLVHLNGVQTVTYARIRKIGTDTERTERQTKVIKTVLEKVKTMPATKWPKLIKSALELVETSMSYSDVMVFLPLLSKNYEIQQIMVPDESLDKSVRGGYYGKNKAWVWQYDLAAAANRIHEFIYEEDASAPAETTTAAVTTTKKSSKK